MRQLEVGRIIAPAFHTRTDVIEGRPLLLPHSGVGSVEASRRHRCAADGATPRLLRPKVVERAQPSSSFGTAQPLRAHAARTVFRKRQATVIKPTPPGTGVMNPATSR